ncbi:hypothetical protein BGZ74_010096 [Mortierella antarctica]|nr:hypothetical protein BGZ74_010096 [Mortierella antarctica]
MCPHLQVLRAKTKHWFLVENIQRPYDPTNDLLVSSTDLSVLDSVMNFIRADEMLQQPWACMGLERLCCRIVGIERLTDAEQKIVDRVLAPGFSKEYTADEAVAVLKSQRCYEQQLGVYESLANLTRLKQLDLGFENRDPRMDRKSARYQLDGKAYVRYNRPTFDTLELSLASGLGRLSTLDNMEMIGFECINHRIGREELAWMAKNWPRLKLVYGLDKEQLPDLEPNKERAALKEYFQQLRPDVAHGSSFVGVLFAEIPELVTLVWCYLTAQDLLTCVQVSSQWHHTFIPSLWHTIDDTTLSWSHILYQCGDPGTHYYSPSVCLGLTYADKNKDREWLIHVF